MDSVERFSIHASETIVDLINLVLLLETDKMQMLYVKIMEYWCVLQFWFTINYFEFQVFDLGQEGKTTSRVASVTLQTIVYNASHIARYQFENRLRN